MASLILEVTFFYYFKIKESKSIALQCLSFQNSSLLTSYFLFHFFLFLARARLLGVFTSLGLEGDVAVTAIMLLGSGGHSVHDFAY